jgi:hypothetical protein
MDTMLDKGYLRAGNVVNLAAAGNANALPVFQVSNNATQIGTKSLKIKKIMIRDNASGVTTRIHFGIGVAGAVVDVMPTLANVVNDVATYEGDEIPDVELFGDLMAWPLAIGAGTFDIQVTVEERG